jgi:hypothetical protein
MFLTISGFIDQLDYFVEHCKNQTCRYGNDFVPLKKRVETILRKENTPVELTFYETKNGQLEISTEFQDEAFYLSRAFTAFQPESIHSIEAFYDVAVAKVTKSDIYS